MEFSFLTHSQHFSCSHPDRSQTEHLERSRLGTRPCWALVLPPCSCDFNVNCTNLEETEALSSLQSASQRQVMLWCCSFCKFSQALFLDLVLSRPEYSKSICTMYLHSIPFVCAIASGVRPWRSGMCRSLWIGEKIA